jgi:hypothetical protein
LLYGLAIDAMCLFLTVSISTGRKTRLWLSTT